MNTNLVMIASALVMGFAGIGLSFMPHEILNYLNAEDVRIMDTLLFQILGALYFAFAMVNWTAKANLIGGIYARPIAIGNLTHFVIGALALMKGYFSSQQTTVLILAIIYVVFAILFTTIFFTHPVRSKEI